MADALGYDVHALGITLWKRPEVCQIFQDKDIPLTNDLNGSFGEFVPHTSATQEIGKRSIIVPRPLIHRKHHAFKSIIHQAVRLFYVLLRELHMAPCLY